MAPHRIFYPLARWLGAGFLLVNQENFGWETFLAPIGARRTISRYRDRHSKLQDEIYLMAASVREKPCINAGKSAGMLPNICRKKSRHFFGRLCTLFLKRDKHS